MMKIVAPVLWMALILIAYLIGMFESTMLTKFFGPFGTLVLPFFIMTGVVVSFQIGARYDYAKELHKKDLSKTEGTNQ